MSRTRFLAAIAVAALLIQLFPQYADPLKWAAILAGGGYLIVRALRTYPKQYRDKKRLAAQRLADEAEFARYTDELHAIRAQYAAADDYEAAIASLYERHRDMLERKFGRA